MTAASEKLDMVLIKCADLHKGLFAYSGSPASSELVSRSHERFASEPDRIVLFV